MQDLIKRLEAWTEETGDFHSDRQLADEVLIADGWRPVQDIAFEGGVRWERKGPGWLTLCSSESTRPHPINDMNAAMGVVPFGCDWQLTKTKDGVLAVVQKSSDDVQVALGDRPTTALVAAALSYIDATRKKQAAPSEARPPSISIPHTSRPA